ncbi:hypothetical protein [Ciceribacter azotifigens]|uniref:hypothetical protein n=1 Tax=Ciceribacter azotifigens TaxID=2069303 RepID=UPI003A88476E
MKFLDPQHPFFRPLWLRILTVVLPAIWAVVEWSNGATGWAIIFLAAAGYAGWQLFLAPDATGSSTGEKPAESRETDKGDEA